MLTDAPDQGLYIHVAGFVFPGVDHIEIVILEPLAPAALVPIAVKHQNDLPVFIAAVVA